MQAVRNLETKALRALYLNTASSMPHASNRPREKLAKDFKSIYTSNVFWNNDTLSLVMQIGSQ